MRPRFSVHPPPAALAGPVGYLWSLADAPSQVGAIARQVELSHRRFLQLFTETVGMTPKRYARVRRFQSALGRLGGDGAPSWTRIALDCGYFDQAHLCRDWTEFTGLSPAGFARLRSVPVKDNHVALPEPDAPT